MRRNKLKAIFAEGRPAVNAWLSIGSSYAAEGIARLGFDSVTVDFQHGMIGFETGLTLFQAISTTDAVPLARVPCNDPAQIMRVLDAGAYGVICPMISSQADALSFAQACRYTDRGNRSYGPSRGLLYGGSDYFDNANDEILVIPMIETRAAVENIEAILGVDGVDMIYIGPNDLALALGERPGQKVDGPETAAAIAYVLACARKAKKPVGIFCPDGVAARARVEQGFDLVTPGNDFGALTRELRSTLEIINGEKVSKSLVSSGY